MASFKFWKTRGSLGVWESKSRRYREERHFLTTLEVRNPTMGSDFKSMGVRNFVPATCLNCRNHKNIRLNLSFNSINFISIPPDMICFKVTMPRLAQTCECNISLMWERVGFPQRGVCGEKACWVQYFVLALLYIIRVVCIGRVTFELVEGL